MERDEQQLEDLQEFRAASSLNYKLVKEHVTFQACLPLDVQPLATLWCHARETERIMRSVVCLVFQEQQQQHGLACPVKKDIPPRLGCPTVSNLAHACTVICCPISTSRVHLLPTSGMVKFLLPEQKREKNAGESMAVPYVIGTHLEGWGPLKVHRSTYKQRENGWNPIASHN